MDPTECQPDRGIGTIVRQPFEPVIAVHLQHAAEPGQMRGRALASGPPNRRRPHRVAWATPRAIVNRIAPQPPCLGPPAARV